MLKESKSFLALLVLMLVVGLSAACSDDPSSTDGGDDGGDSETETETGSVDGDTDTDADGDTDTDADTDTDTDADTDTDTDADTDTDTDTDTDSDSDPGDAGTDDGGPGGCENLVVAPSSDTIVVGQDAEFTAACTRGGAIVDVTAEVDWSSDDEMVATVVEGVATGLAEGTATITAEIDGQMADATLTVEPDALEAIALDPMTVTVTDLEATPTVDFVATCSYLSGLQELCMEDLVWASSMEDVATVDQDGTATPVGNGDTTITATVGDVVGSASLTVDVGLVCEELVVSAGAVTELDVNGTVQLQAACDFGTGLWTNVSDLVTWGVTAGTALSVSDTGMATGVEEGEGTITATYVNAIGADTTGDIILTVAAVSVTRVEVAPATLSIPIGETGNVTATIFYSDGTSTTSADPEVTVTWASDAEAMATVAAGVVTGVAAGTANITATVDGVTSINATAVTVYGGVLTGVVISPVTVTVASGVTQAFTLTAQYNDGNSFNVTADNDTTWTLTGTGATLADNVATAVTPGSTVTITGSYGGYDAEATLTVSDATLTGIEATVDPVSATIAVGEDATVSVEGSYSDGSTADLTGSATFTVDPSGGLTAVDNVFTGALVGPATVTATVVDTAGTFTDDVVITVSPAQVTEIEIAAVPADALDDELTPGDVVQLVATGYTTDPSDIRDLTDEVTWVSSAPDKVTVSNTAGLEGQARAMVPGSSMLSATYGSLTSNALEARVSNDQVGELSYLRIIPSAWEQVRGTTQNVSVEGCDVDDVCSTLGGADRLVWTVENTDGDTVSNVIGMTISGDVSTAYGIESTYQQPNHILRVRASVGTVTATADVRVWDDQVTNVVVNCDEPRDCIPAAIEPSAGDTVYFPFFCEADITTADGNTFTIGDDDASDEPSDDITSIAADWDTTDEPVSTGETVAVHQADGDGYVDQAGTSVVSLSFDMNSGQAPAAVESTDDTDATLQVEALSITNISVTVAPTTIRQGEEAQATATATYQGTGETCGDTFQYTVNTIADWTSSSLSDAAVTHEGDGLFTGDESGTVTIYAQVAANEGAALLVIQDSCIDSVSIGTTNYGILADDEEVTYPEFVSPQLIAQAERSNGTVSVDRGTMGTWSGGAVNADSWMVDLGSAGTVELTYTVSSGTCDGQPVSDTMMVNVVAAQPPMPGTVPGILQLNDGLVGTRTDIGPNESVPMTVIAYYDADIDGDGYDDWDNDAYIDVTNFSSFINQPAVTELTNALDRDAYGEPVRNYTLSAVPETVEATAITATYKNHTTNEEWLDFQDRILTDAEIVDVVSAADQAIPAAGIPRGLPLYFTVQRTYSDTSTDMDTDNDCTYEETDDEGTPLTADFLLEDFVNNATTTVAVGTAYVVATCNVDGDDIESDPFPVVINNATLAQITFVPDDPTTAPRNSVFDVLVYGQYTNAQTWDISADHGLTLAGSYTVLTFDGTACTADSCPSATVGATGTQVATTDDASTGPDLIRFTKDGVETFYAVTTTATCIASIELWSQGSELPADSTSGEDYDYQIIDVPNGREIQINARGIDTGNDVSDQNRSPNASWSPSDDVVTFVANATGPVSYWADSSDLVVDNTTVISYTITGDNVCDGGDLGDNTITVQAYYTVREADAVDIQLLPQPATGNTSVYIPAGQTVYFNIADVLSDGSVDSTQDTFNANGAEYVLASTGTCAGADFGAYVTDRGFPVKSDTACTGSLYTTATGTSTFDDAVNIAVQDCGNAILSVTPATPADLPVGHQTRQFTVTARYENLAGCNGTAAELNGHDVSHLLAPDYTVDPDGNGWDDGDTADDSGVDDLGNFNSTSLYTPVNPGEVTVQAYYNGGSSDVVTWDNVDVYLDSLTINAASSVAEDTTIGLTVTSVWTDGTQDFTLPIPGDTTCSTNNANVTVTTPDADGDAVVTGVNANTTSVVTCDSDAGDGGATVYSNSLTISVTDACIAQISALDMDQDALYIGTPFTLDPTCLDSNGELVEDEDCAVTYTLIDNDDAAVDTAFFGADLLTDMGRARVSMDSDAGDTAVIRASVSTADGACDSDAYRDFTVTVLDGYLDYIVVDGQSPVPISYNADYSATGYVWDGDSYEDIDLTYAADFVSLNDEIATFRAGENVMDTHAIEGTTTVRAAYEGVVSIGVGEERDVDVMDKQPESLTISADVETLVGGGTDSASIPAQNGATRFSVQLRATVTYTDGTSDLLSIGDGDLHFSPGPEASPAVLAGLTVSGAGLVRSGTGTGAQVIYAYYDGPYSTTVEDEFTMNVVPGNVETLTIVNADGSDAAASIVKGTTNEYAVVAELVGSDSLYWVTNDVTFATNDADTVSIPGTTSDGSVTATGEEVGTAQLSASAAGIVDTLMVTVTEAEPTGIDCTPTPMCITVDDKAQVHVQVTFTDASTQLVTAQMLRSDYSVDDTAIADFLSQDPVGVISGMGESLVVPAEVTVMWGGFESVCDVYVAEDIEDLVPSVCESSSTIFTSNLE